MPNYKGGRVGRGGRKYPISKCRACLRFFYARELNDGLLCRECQKRAVETGIIPRLGEWAKE